MFSYAKNVASSPMDCTAEVWREILADKDGKLLRICQQVQACKERAKVLEGEGKTEEMHRALDEAGRWKKMLPVFCFQATFPDGKRSNKGAKPNGLVMIDLDGLEEPRRTFGELLAKDKDFFVGQAVLVTITPSGHGLRVVFKGNQQMDYVQNQHWFGEHFGVKVDEACKDLARCSFAVPDKYVIFESEGLFRTLPQPLSESEGRRASAEPKLTEKQMTTTPSESEGRSLTPDPSPKGEGSNYPGNGAATQLQHAEQKGTVLEQLERDAEGNFLYRGMRIDDIIEQFFVLTGGKLASGERNMRLQRLAVNLRYILENDAEAVKAVVMKHAAGLAEAEVAAIAKKACEYSMNCVMPKTLQAAIENVKVRMRKDEDKQDDGEEGSLSMVQTGYNELSVDYEFVNSRIDEIKFPASMNATMAGVPKEMRMGALLAMLPFLYTLLTRICFKFYDGRWCRLSGQTYVLGDAATGKSFINEIAAAWLAPINAIDAMNRAKLDEWKEKKQKAGQGKMAEAKPKLLIRNLPTQSSLATIQERMKNAKEMARTLDGNVEFVRHLHCVTWDSEIATLLRTLKQNFSSFLDILIKSFHDEKYGSDYQNTESVNAIFNTHWNVCFGGTWLSGKKLFGDATNGHPLRAMIFPMPGRHFEMIEKDGNARSRKQEETIRAAAYLCNAQEIEGNVICKQLNEALYEWCKREAEISRETQDFVRDTTRRRGALIGVRAGIAFAVLEQIKSFEKFPIKTDKEGALYRELPASENAVKFAILVADFCSEMQRLIFGERMLGEGDSFTKEKYKSKKRDTFLSKLPNATTFKECCVIFKDMKPANVRQTLYRLTDLGLIHYDDKTKKYWKKIIK